MNRTSLRRRVQVVPGDPGHPGGHRAAAGGVRPDLLDVVTDTGVRPTPFGPPVSFATLAAQAGFSADEQRLLATAQARSDALAKIEQQAFALIAQTGAAPEAVHDQATALLYGTDYLHAKAEIMGPIGQVLTLVDGRTARESAQAVGRARAWSIGAVVVGLLLLAGMAVFAAVTRRAVPAAGAGPGRRDRADRRRRRLTVLLSGVVAGLSVLAVAADSVMNDLQAETAAGVLDLGDRLAEEV